MVTDSQGIHGVAASDFRGGGMIDWYGAMAWVGYLNSSRYLGQNTWSLPAADPVCGAAYNCTNSQLGSLFYSSLGGVANTSNIPIHTSYSLFTNIQNGTYWSGTEYAPYTSVASWVFLLGYGYQSAWGKISGIYSWVMLPGNVSTIAAVPEPGEWTMMLAGFGLIGVIARRR
ncbi:MAG: PEPxxWA-CTERM sorting domain-containing protein [Burkholderiales bacterium]|nr:PEPxxWA-CTERM sorting domain-containing protein [Burkholderiales bacterium]